MQSYGNYGRLISVARLEQYSEGHSSREALCALIPLQHAAGLRRRQESLP